MDSKLALLKCVSLYYCESLLQDVNVRSKALVANVIGSLVLPQQVNEGDTSRTGILALRDTILWMEKEDRGEYDLVDLMQRVKLASGDDYSVQESIGLLAHYKALTQEELNATIGKARKELSKHCSQNKIRDLIKEANRKILYGGGDTDTYEIVEELIGELSELIQHADDTQKEFFLNVMSMSDPESIRTVLEKAKEDNEGKGGFKTGWQAVNRMLGESEQFRRGMFVLVGALTHNYKSGFTHDLFRHFCVYNTPELNDPTKKPLLLYYSAENRAEEDLIRMYVALKENETGVAVNIHTIDPVEAATYVSSRLTERGFSVEMKRIDPGNFTHNDLFNDVIDYESKGYEVQAIVFDYLNLISKRALPKTSLIGEDSRLMIQTVRTFMSARDILFITPHQLSQEAMGKKREGVVNFLADIAGKNYWDGSKRIANEVDLEIFLDIVAFQKCSYLHVHRGKHRTVKSTPAQYLEFYLPFSQVGYIPEDIEGEERSVRYLAGSIEGFDMDEFTS